MQAIVSDSEKKHRGSLRLEECAVLCDGGKVASFFAQKYLIRNI